MKFNTALKVFVAIIIAELAGVIGLFFAANSVSTWYATQLVRPSWNPSSWVFGPVWITLYAMMGITSYLVWSAATKRTMEGGVQKASLRKRVRGALTIYGMQLALNAAWSIIFFGLRSPGWAFVEIVFLWIAIVATIGVFWRISKPAAWLLVPYILWVSFAGYLNYTIWSLNQGGSTVQPYCTMEAKVCPDGSSVGRSGPKCEFAACPESRYDTTWKTATDEEKGITFRYPEDLGTTYMRAYDWPPQVAITNGPFECTDAGSEIERAGRTHPWKIDDRTYCVTEVVQGAAGSMYTQYAYAVERGPQVWIFTATVRATQCGNYDEPHMYVDRYAAYDC
ncbi:MAG: Integral membrane protein [Candidatus Wolfebacteria bacterium GW2011_GWB1_47_243]|nr:MAG: Integral membrane protein [Candidatus Wolfebacteria bacterium GW2011_GWB1_47_243]